MKQIPTQQDGSTELSADDFNQIPREEENLIQSQDITLDGGNLNQMGDSVSHYASSGDFYLDSGSANDIVLVPYTGEPGESKRTPTEYRKGLRVRFIPAANNTGAATARIGTLDPLAVTREYYGNGGASTLSQDDIQTNIVYEMVYFESPDTLEKYWIITSPDVNLNLDYARRGGIDISVSGDPSYIYRFGQDDLYLRKKNFTGNQEEWQLACTSEASIFNFNEPGGDLSTIQIKPEDGAEIEQLFNNIGFGTYAKGFKYYGALSPGDDISSVRFRRAKYTATGINWSSTSADQDVYRTADDIVTDIPSSVGLAGVYRVDLSINKLGTEQYIVPAFAAIVDNGSFLVITALTITLGSPVTPESDFDVYVEYDASSL